VTTEPVETAELRKIRVGLAIVNKVCAREKEKLESQRVVKLMEAKNVGLSARLLGDLIRRYSRTRRAGMTRVSLSFGGRMSTHKTREEWSRSGARSGLPRKFTSSVDLV